MTKKTISEKPEGTGIDRKSIAIRGLYMLLFLVIGSFAVTIIGAIAIFQFVMTLITGAQNTHLLTFSQSLALYFYQMAQFLMYTSETKPYPFSEWPTK